MANIELDGVNKKIKVDSGDLTLDVPGDIVLDADGGDVVVADGGTNILKVTNSSSDVVLQPQVDAKDIIFKQYDGTTVATVEDNGTFNVPANKLAIGGTAVTSTAAELNILDGVTATAAELNLIDGGTARGTTAIADGDGVLINDAGTMRMTSVETLKTYMGAETNEPYFLATGSGTQSLTEDVNSTIQYNSLRDSLDSASGYNTSTYTYTVQTGGAGFWYLAAGNYVASISQDKQVDIQIHVGGAEFFVSRHKPGASINQFLQVFGIHKLAVGDAILVKIFHNDNSARNASNNANNSFFGGFRIKSL
jgi:hypothetical protein